jgi:hypothetical protein
MYSGVVSWFHECIVVVLAVLLEFLVMKVVVCVRGREIEEKI